MNHEELQKYLDDHNIILEEYLRNNMITDEERKELGQRWNAAMIEALYGNFENG